MTTKAAVVRQTVQLAIACVLVCLALPRPASAQVTTGAVFGTVKDAQGGVIPGVTLVLTSETRGTKTAPVVTNATGDYVFPNVTADRYTLDATMNGFKGVKRPGVVVSPGDRVALPLLTLEVGGATETVDVKGEAPVIQAQSGERSFTVETEAVQNLPVQNRTFSSLAAFAPGMSNSGGTNPARLGSGGANNATFDGIGIIDTGSNSIQLTMNMEAVAEVKVLTSSYQAEYGRSAGVQISAVTKSGTNQFRGSVYDVKRNSDWNANSWVNKQNGVAKTITKQDDWGYSLGGPMGKPGGSNKLFFFFSQEWRPRTTGGQVARYRVPTAAERAGDFSQSRDNNGNIYNLIKDPLSTSPCTAANNAGCFADGGVLGKIPAHRLYGVGLNILNMWPQPNDSAGYAASGSYNYSAIKPTVKSHGRQEAIRGDYQFNEKLRLSSKLITQDNSHEANNNDIRFGTGTTSLIPGFNDMVDWVPLMLQWSGSVNYTWNSTTFIEGSYGGFYNQIATTPIDAASNKNNVGLGGFPMLFPDANIIDPRFYSYRILNKLGGDAPPYFVDGRSLVPPTFTWGSRVANAPPNISDFGCCFTLNRVQNINISITKVMSRHTAKAGYYLDHSYKPQTAGVGSTGSYRGAVDFGNSTNNPLDTTFGFANAAVGSFTTYLQANRFLEGNYVYNNVEWFVQDNWKVNGKLTLDYGIRFVHQPPQYDTYGFSSQFFESEWKSSAAPTLYKPACAPGGVPGQSSCTGQNIRAQNTITGTILGPGSSSLVGQIIPGSGSTTNGVFPAGQSPNVKENYTWPSLVYAPRFGFAYDWSGTQKFVIRGGGGLYYDRPNGNSMFGQITNPPAQSSVTVTNGQLQTLSSGQAVSAPAGMSVFQFDAKTPMAFNSNIGVQIALPWSMALDAEYVGIRGQNLLATTDINAPDFGASYNAANWNPTTPVTASTLPGATALPVNFYRPFIGYGAINRNMTVGYNNFHSLQTSLNRRFSHGVSYTMNYTFSRDKGTAGNGVRIMRDSGGNIVLRPDQDTVNYQLTGSDRTHVVKANFVWDMPDLKRTGTATNVIGLIINDWQLSGVFTGGSGAPYTVGFSYQDGTNATVLTGTPNYNARIRLVGDPGKGCSNDPTRQFNTAAFAGPQPGSIGDESGLNYMRGCPDHTLDLAIARNIRLGKGRQLQIRAEMYNATNAVIFTGRNGTMNMSNINTSTAATNLPYDANGNVIPANIIPRSAGFGAVSNSNAARSVQLTIRFSF